MKTILKLGLVSLIVLATMVSCKRQRITENDCGKTITKKSIIKDKGNGVDYVFDCMLIINDGKLTIEDGVHIQFEGENSGIYVSDDGELDILGTSGKKVILEGKTPTHGSWMGVIIASDKDNEIKHAEIYHAGSGTHQWMYDKAAVGLAFKNENARISISNTTIAKSGGHGLYVSHATGNLQKFDDNILEDNKGYGVLIPFNEIGELDKESRYHNPNLPNTEAYIGLYSQDKGGNRQNLTSNVTLYPLDVPYKAIDPLFVNSILKIKPSVQFHFAPDSYMTVFGEDSSAYIEAIGGSGTPILFTRASSPDGNVGWNGIYFDNDSPLNLLKECVIEYGGKAAPFNTIGLGNIVVGNQNYGGRAKVQNCLIRYSFGYGIDKSNNAAFSGSANNFQANALGDIGNF